MQSIKTGCLPSCQHSPAPNSCGMPDIASHFIAARNPLRTLTYAGMHVCYTHERTLRRICTLSMHACMQIAWGQVHINIDPCRGCIRFAKTATSAITMGTVWVAYNMSIQVSARSSLVLVGSWLTSTPLVARLTQDHWRAQFCLDDRVR
jgi:hypothetical protein